ncbi:MAG: RDD family protein [Bdellovibrionia bacterium]
MVIKDLSSDFFENVTANSKHQVAPVADRFLAFIIDFLIFSPVIGLFVAGLSKRLKFALLIEARASELFVITFLLALVVFGLVVLFQSLFVYFWQATPGQRFVQIRVINFEEPQSPLKFSQSLLRSFFWAMSLFLVGVPFLESLGHYWRRCFHERASETISVTLKKNVSTHPLYIEQRFMGSWIGIFFLTLAATLFLYSFQLWQSLQSGALFTSQYQFELCPEVKGPTASFARMDSALTSYFSKRISGACLEKEADFILWNVRDSEQQGFAYWAKYLLETDKSYKDRYQAQICDSEEFANACLALQAKNNSDAGKSQELITRMTPSAVRTYMLASVALQQSLYLQAAQHAQELKNYQAVEAVAEKLLVQTAFKLLEQQKEKGREPASLEQDSFLQRFKEEFGIQ